MVYFRGKTCDGGSLDFAPEFTGCIILRILHNRFLGGSKVDIIKSGRNICFVHAGKYRPKNGICLIN